MQNAERKFFEYLSFSTGRFQKAFRLFQISYEKYQKTREIHKYYNELKRVEGLNMSKVLTERQVLEKLQISDFRHLTKDKVIKMASLLDRMDPEVAKKALEQFPEFSSSIKSMLADYKDTLDKSIEANEESVQKYYDSCNSIIESLQTQLDGDLSFEEKQYIIDKMFEIAKMMGDKDSENKKFIATLAFIGAAAVSIATAVLAVALGGNTTIETKDIDQLN